MQNRRKIEVAYPDGSRDCQETVADTYRNAIEYLGFENVRSVGIKRNSINIVSTRDEMEHSTGKKETHAISLLGKSSDLGVCTQFKTEDKYRYLVEINEALHAGLNIRLIEADEVETSVFIPEEAVAEDVKEGLLN